MLDELLTGIPQSRIHYWRDAAGHEVDFAIVAGRDRVAAVEAKISPDGFSPKALARFRKPILTARTCSVVLTWTRRSHSDWEVSRSRCAPQRRWPS